MKKEYLLITALSVAVMAVGCKKTDTTTDDSASTNTNNSVADTTSNVLDSTKAAATNAWADVKEGSSNAWEKTKEVTTNAWDSVKESLQSSANYTYDKKDAFVADAQADLAVLDQKIKNLSDKVAASGDSVKADAQAKLQDLQTQRTALDKKLDDVKNSTEATWGDTKTAFINSYNDTKSSLKQAWQWLKDKTNS
jgi:hypothetical protein